MFQYFQQTAEHSGAFHVKSFTVNCYHKKDKYCSKCKCNKVFDAKNKSVKKICDSLKNNKIIIIFAII